MSTFIVGCFTEKKQYVHMQYLVGDIKQGVAGFQSVHVYRNKQPRLSCKHTEVTQGLEMIPEESKNPPRTNTFV